MKECGGENLWGLFVKNDWIRINFWFLCFWNLVGIKYMYCFCKNMIIEELVKWVLFMVWLVKVGVYIIFLSFFVFKLYKKLSIYLVFIVWFSMELLIDYS